MATAARMERTLFRPLTAVGTVALLVGAAACGGSEAEDDFPSEQLEIIVPWSPGGSGDQTARQLASVAEDTCGTGITVRNQEGSAGAVGYQATADSGPDGYTLGVVGIELAILEHLGVSEMSPEDLRPVMQYSLQPIAYGVPADSPIESMDDLIAAAEEGEVTVATSGTGSIYHIGYAGMAEEAGVNDSMTNVPFDGAATALQAALGGETDVVSVGAAELAPHVDSGDLRAIGIAGEDRQEEILPDVPTLAEEGIEWTSGAILGLVVPVDTPDDVVTTLNECLNEARESAEFSEFMENQGFTQEYRDAAEFEEFLQSEFDRYGELVETAGITAEEDG